MRAPPGRQTQSRTSLAPARNSRLGANRVPSISSAISSGRSDASGQDMADDHNLSSPSKSDELLSPTCPSPVLSRGSIASAPRALTDAPPSNATVSSNRMHTSTAASARELEDLKSKLRLMERKRLDDREKLKEMDQIQADRDKFEAIIQKLQTKYQPQQQELNDLRKQLKDSSAKLQAIEAIQADHDSTLEMAALDREMAEETAEALRAELDVLKLRTEELNLEVEVLREENTELSTDMSPEERASHGWLQMERNNERLKEALIRLRDMTQQTEEELKDQIESLEEDVKDFANVKEQYEIAKERLVQAEGSVEDLRQQLEGALGAEDMILELTETNAHLNDRIKELNAAVEDLESLKELSDEFEINHIEIEKEMQEDIDHKDAFIVEQLRKDAKKDEQMSDMEYTISKFRDLVNNLQNDLQDMKASHAMTETEAEKLNDRSRAILDLNMKLQATAAKTQVKAIDLESRRLEAQEAAEHLAIVQLFLPEAFQEDRDSVLALLRFKRVAFKANMLHGFIKERMNQALRGHEDDAIAACDILNKLSWITTMCACFINDISHCSLEQFAKYEGALYELEPVERALNAWVDGLRREDLNEKKCATELQRSIALLSHLGEIHIAPGLASHADDVHMRSLIMQTNLENASATFVIIRTMVQDIVTVQGDEDEAAARFSSRSEGIVAQTRSAKVVISKATRILDDLKARNLSLHTDALDKFDQCSSAVQELGDYARRLGTELHATLHEEGRVDPYVYAEVENKIQQVTLDVFTTNDVDFFATYASKLRVLGVLFSELTNIISDLGRTQEFERLPAPWITRSEQIRAAKIVPVDAEDEMRRLRDENLERARLIALRDKTLEENSVKIEHLEARMRDAGKKSSKVMDLERALQDAKKRQVELEQAVAQREMELQSLEGERANWQRMAEDLRANGVVAGTGKPEEGETIVAKKEIEQLRHEIARLQAAVRYLRSDNRSRTLGRSQDLDWLDAPLTRPQNAEQQRRRLVAQEGHDVLDELLTLCTGPEARIPDLIKSQGNSLAWRPAKETSTYWAAKRRDEYEAWRDWSGAVTKEATAVLGIEACKRNAIARRQAQATSKRAPAARVAFKLPDVDDPWSLAKAVGGEEVRIVGADEWDAFRRPLALA